MARPTVRYASTRALRQPAADVTARLQRRPVSSALLLLGLLLLIVWLRNGRQLPDRRRTLALGIGAAVVAVSASAAPEFVTALLIAALVVAAIDNEAVVTSAIRSWITNLTGSSSSQAPVRQRTGLAPI